MSDTSVKRELETPLTPNYLFYANPPVGRRQGGFQEREKLDIADVPDDVLRALGAQWIEKLVASAASRRAAR